MPDREVHSRALLLPAATSRPRRPGAVNYLVPTLRASPGEVTLVGVAPLSNIDAALVLALDLVEASPRWSSWATPTTLGNITPSAEIQHLVRSRGG